MGQSGAALPQRVQLADWQCSILTFIWQQVQWNRDAALKHE